MLNLIAFLRPFQMKKLLFSLFLFALGVTGTGYLFLQKAAGQSASQSVFTTQTPVVGDVSDGQPYELGMKFQSNTSGRITALRYWKPPSETGTHTGRLWGTGGALLGSATFTNETASGWQTATLAAPISIQVSTVYVVSVNTNAHFPITYDALGSAITNGNLSSVADNANGLYGTISTFPTNSFRNSNYFRDIVFVPDSVTQNNLLNKVSGDSQQGVVGSTLAQPLVVQVLNGSTPVSGVNLTFAVTSGGGSLSTTNVTTGSDGRASVNWTLGTTLGSKSVQVSGGGLTSLTFSATAVVGSASKLALTPATTSVSPGGTVTYQVSVQDSFGNLVTGATNAITLQVSGLNGTTSFNPASPLTPSNGVATSTLTVAAGASGTGTVTASATGLTSASSSSTLTVQSQAASQTVFTTQIPVVGDVSDGQPYELGMKFQANTSGQITALRYWKPPSETGTHTGRLWGTGGTLLGSATFTNETASGWQTATLAAPISIQASTVYVVSVNANAHFPITYDALGSVITNGNLSSIADNANGLYGTISTFPTNSFRNSNYFRDIVFTPSGGGGQSNVLSKVSGDSQQGVVGSTLAQPLVVQVLNGSTPVSGVNLTFAVTSGGGSLSTTNVTTGSDGRASVNWTLGTTLGSKSVQVSGGGLTSLTFSATAVVGSASKLALTPATTSVSPGGTVTYQVSVQDSFGNLVTGATNAITLQVSGLNGTTSFNPASPLTPSNGVATSTLTVAAGASGTGTVTASALGLTSASSQVSVVSSSPTLNKVSGDAQQGAIGSTLAQPLVVQVLNGSTPVGGVNLTFAVTSGGGSLSATNVTTGSDGLASVSWALGATPGVNNVQVTGNGLTPLTFTATAQPGGLAKLILSHNGVQLGVGSTVSLTATLQDASGNTITNFSQPVGFSLRNGLTGTLTPTSQVPVNGVATFSFTSNAVSSGLIRVEVNGIYSVIQVAAVSGSVTTYFDAIGTTQTQGNVGLPLSSPYTIRVSNASNNVIANFPVRFSVTGGGGSASVTSTTTNSQGLASTVFTLGTKAGYNALVAGSTNLALVNVLEVQGIAAAPAKLSLAPGNASTFVGQPLTYNAQIQDIYGNTVTTSTALVNFSKLGLSGNFSAPSASAVAGVASVSFTPIASSLGTLTASSSNLTSSTASLTVLASTTNPIVAENQQSGTQNWLIGNQSKGVQNNDIEGYGSSPSTNIGGNVTFYVNTGTQSRPYNIEVYRVGYYGGQGGRLMQTVGPLQGQVQTPCAVTDQATKLVECNWAPSYTLNVPNNWVSGLYLAKLVRQDTGSQTYIMFVVRDDARVSDILFQSPLTNYAAYNSYGGYCLYAFCNSGGVRAYKVSLDRPFQVFLGGDCCELNTPLRYEFQMIRWLESQGYDVSYATSLDAEVNPQLMLNHQVFLSESHDEYWSANMRTTLTNAQNLGRNLAFFSANSIYWRIRFEPSSTNNTANRVVVSYKENFALDPVAPTTLWRDPANAQPENALLGVMYTGDNDSTALTGYDFVVSNSAHPYFANTGLNNGDRLSGLVGFEWDGLISNGAAPSNLEVLSASPVTATSIAPQPSGLTANQIANAVRYVKSNGAKVFSVGTIQWSWGLDNFSIDQHTQRVDLRAQQITVNIFADMNAKPLTPSSGIVVPTTP
jgi:plastocyanin